MLSVPIWKSSFLILSLACLLGGAHSLSGALVFSIGTFDSKHAEFEQESGSMNDNQFYVHAGNYSGISGLTGGGGIALQPEILSDGPTAAEWTLTKEGFRRALTYTASSHKQDLFFMLNAEQAAQEKLLFRINFFQMGSDSSHDVQLSLNGQVFASMNGITAPTGIRQFWLEAPDFTWNEGANVIGLNRAGGTDSWIAIDAVDLYAVPEPRVTLLLAMGLVLCFMRRKLI